MHRGSLRTTAWHNHQHVYNVYTATACRCAVQYSILLYYTPRAISHIRTCVCAHVRARLLSIALADSRAIVTLIRDTVYVDRRRVLSVLEGCRLERGDSADPDEGFRTRVASRVTEKLKTLRSGREWKAAILTAIDSDLLYSGERVRNAKDVPRVSSRISFRIRGPGWSRRLLRAWIRGRRCASRREIGLIRSGAALSALIGSCDPFNDN